MLLSPRASLCRYRSPRAPRPPCARRRLLLVPITEPDLGFDAPCADAYRGVVLPPFGLTRIVTEWGIEPFPTILTVWVAGAYLVGVRTLRARADRWPIGRTLAFVGGMLVFYVATTSGLAAYDTTLLSAHMTQHMLLSMVVPLLLALGAPVTLALRTLPRRPRSLAADGAALAGGQGADVPAADFPAVRAQSLGPVLLAAGTKRRCGRRTCTR